jgi:beta-lactamase superfamily II metal-dependent hydrolase
MRNRQTVRGAGKERKLFGYIEAISMPSDRPPRVRGEIIFDAIDIDANSRRALDPAGLCIVRLSTTANRLATALGIQEEALSEGMWLRLEITPIKGYPSVWILDAANAYGGQPVRSNLVAARIMSPNDIETTESLTSVMALCKVAEPANHPPQLPDVGEDLEVRVVDVGQANCVAVHKKGERTNPAFYFDVGSPLFFHRRSLPRHLPEPAKSHSAKFVLLSHWDFDHYAMAVTAAKHLQKVAWIAPDQKVGPNAAALQKALGSRLTLLSSSSVTLSKVLKLWKGGGPASDKNESGYTLRVKRSAGYALLAGDVGYTNIPAVALRNLNGLVICHHGGKGAGSSPSGAGLAAVSYGLPNRYGHPDASHMAGHSTGGWTVRPTVAHGMRPRGDRWI